MKIQIITIGDEILIGQIVDTNSAWMSAELTKKGFKVVDIESVGDNSTQIKDAITRGFQHADILLLTGGIGPTNDDITKKVLCEYFHSSMVFNNDVLNNILEVFSSRNLELNELTRNQAFVPDGAQVIQNKVGTAPILWFNNGDNKVLVSMPGVPFEMKWVMNTEIIPSLQSKFSLEQYFQKSFLVAGITESKLAIVLKKFEDELPPNYSLAYLPSFGMIRLRLFTRGNQNSEELERQAAKLKQFVKELIVSEDELSLEELIGKVLHEKGLTISTAESCTGGFIAHKITLIPGSSNYYKGSIVAYNNEIKKNILSVKEETLNNFGAVSMEVVQEMANGVTELFETDCSIAVSGISGPDGGTPQKPVGSVWVCTRIKNKTVSILYHTGRTREENISRAANMALLQFFKMIKTI